MGRIVYKVRVQLITKWEAEVFRVFELYKNTSLEDFHKMLKWSFHWTDEDDGYKFINRERKRIIKSKERVTPLGDLLENVGDKIKYIFNLDEKCEHIVTLEGVRELEESEDFQFKLLEVEGTSLGIQPFDYTIQHGKGAKGEEYELSEEQQKLTYMRLEYHRNRIRKGDINFANLSLLSTEELLEILKKEGSYPDLKLVKEILKRKGVSKLILSEVKELTSRSNDEILKEKTYIKNLFYLLAELECEECFPIVRDIGFKEKKFLDEFYGLSEVMMDFIFSRVGKGNIDELIEIATKPEVREIEDNIIIALRDIYKKGGEKNLEIQNFLENIYPSILQPNEKRIWEIKTFWEKDAKNIYEFYENLEKFNDDEDAVWGIGLDYLPEEDEGDFEIK